MGQLRAKESVCLSHGFWDLWHSDGVLHRNGDFERECVSFINLYLLKEAFSPLRTIGRRRKVTCRLWYDYYWYHYYTCVGNTYVIGSTTFDID